MNMYNWAVFLAALILNSLSLAFGVWALSAGFSLLREEWTSFAVLFALNAATWIALYEFVKLAGLSLV